MWVCDHSLHELELLCSGYSTALACHGIDEFGSRFNERFRDHLWEKYQWSMCSGWAYGIRQHADCDGEELWRRFYELLDEFCEAAPPGAAAKYK